MPRLIAEFQTDLRYAIRAAGRRPLLSIVIVATLALGIGVSSGVFTLFDAAVLTPHVASDPASFVQIYVASSTDRTRPGRPGRATLDEYVAFGAARSLKSIVATQRVVVPAGGDAVRVSALLVTCNFFEANGAGPALIGRLLTRADCDSANPVAVAGGRDDRPELDAAAQGIARFLSLTG